MREAVRSPDLIRRFEEKYIPEPNSGCWLWTAAYHKRQGYGTFHLENNKKAFAHIVSYNIYVGEVPKGLVLDHVCKNTACCNPQHLEPVTQLENIHRGDGPTARNKKKTHCLRGHLLPETRTSQGFRMCRTCASATQLKRVYERRGDFAKARFIEIERLGGVR